MRYEEMSLLELRLLAKSKGVKAPTTLKKAELVKSIKLTEENKAINSKSSRGRPPIPSQLFTSQQMISLVDKIEPLASEIKQIILDEVANAIKNIEVKTLEFIRKALEDTPKNDNDDKKDT